MASAAMSDRQPVLIGRYDHVFYSTVAILMAVTVFIGFAPTYYLRAFFGRPTVTGAVTLTPLAHLHGAIFTAWVLLFVVQTTLVASHRVKTHRRLGILTGVLAAAMVAVGVATAVKAAARGAAPPGADPLGFLIVPLCDVVMFSTFIVAALCLRNRKEAHKRLMLLAYISILAAAVARLPGVLPLGPFGFFGLAFLFLLAGIIYDLVSRRRVHPAYIWGGTLLVISVPLRLMASGTETWRAMAEYLVRQASP